MTRLKRLPWPEIITALSVTAGWFLLILAASAVTVWAWPIGAGLYLMALAGFRLIGVLAWQGLYTLAREEDDG